MCHTLDASQQAASGRSVSFGRYDGQSLSVENAKTLVHALVASQIDFCNSILYRENAIHLHPLQSVLNAAARLVLKLRKFDRVSISSMIRNERRHWLPVHKRIIYKLCLLVFKCQNKQAPTYLSSLCHSQLSQPVVSCGQHPEATSISREHELSHTAHGHLQFLDLHVGTHYCHI